MSENEAEASGGTAIRLRAMAGADIAQCVPLLTQLGYEMTADEAVRRAAEILSTPGHLLMVAELAGRIAGLLHVFDRPAIENPREAVVQAIVVDQACHRAGVGRMLMRAAECWGGERGCRSIVLSSNVVRTPAHAFYTALGYRVSATAYVMRKPLAR